MIDWLRIISKTESAEPDSLHHPTPSLTRRASTAVMSTTAKSDNTWAWLIRKWSTASTTTRKRFTRLPSNSWTSCLVPLWPSASVWHPWLRLQSSVYVASSHRSQLYQMICNRLWTRWPWLIWTCLSTVAIEKKSRTNVPAVTSFLDMDPWSTVDCRVLFPCWATSAPRMI